MGLTNPSGGGEYAALILRIWATLDVGRRLEPLDVGLHPGLRRQQYQAGSQHHAAGVTECAAGMVRGLVKVRHRRFDSKLGPQLLQHAVTREAMPGRERQQLHEIPRTPVRPGSRRHELIVDPHLEPAEQADLDVFHPADNHRPGSRRRVVR
jgi:hypothetical protein